MVTVTEAASKQITEILASQEDGEYVIRLSITGRGPQGFEYELTLIKEDEKDAGDVLTESQGIKLVLAGENLESLKGASLDFVEQGGGTGFKIDNPNPLWTDPIAKRVQEVIDTEINPGVASHGGYVALLDVKDSRAFIKLGGGCQGCGMADVTLKQGIEVAIKKAVPEISDVLDSTDHAAGDNPYYQPAKGGESPFN